MHDSETDRWSDPQADPVAVDESREDPTEALPIADAGAQEQPTERFEAVDDAEARAAGRADEEDAGAWWAPAQDASAPQASAHPTSTEPAAPETDTAASQHAQPTGYPGSPMTAAMPAGYVASPYGPVPADRFPAHPAAYPAVETGAVPGATGQVPAHPMGAPAMTGQFPVAYPATATGAIPAQSGAMPAQAVPPQLAPGAMPTMTGAMPVQPGGPGAPAVAQHELVAQPWPAVPGTAHGSGAPRSRAGLIAAIAGLCALLLLLLSGLTVAGIYVASSLQSMEGTIEQAPAPGTPGGDAAETVPGTVLDSSGAPVDDLGTPDAPAVMGENTLSWPTDDGGTLILEIESVTWNADEDIKASDPSAPAPEAGMHYALVTIRGTYEGEKYAVLGDDIDLAIETDGGVYYDDGQIRAPEPLWRQGGITDGESASGQMVIAVPEAEVGSALVSVAPWGGDYLYVSVN